MTMMLEQGLRIRFQRRLKNKRNKTVEALKGFGLDLGDCDEDEKIIRLAYAYLGREVRNLSMTYSGVQARYANIIQWCKRRDRGENLSKNVNRDIAEFYRSYDWRKIRYAVLETYGPVCMCCGWERSDGIKIHVDHIKPLRFNWDLRLDFDNLQVLCEICNHGKGNWDRTDWRPEING